MSENLGEFFSLIGKAKKEKEDEFRSLVGDLDIDSMFSQVKDSIKEDIRANFATSLTFLISISEIS